MLKPLRRFHHGIKCYHRHTARAARGRDGRYYRNVRVFNFQNGPDGHYRVWNTLSFLHGERTPSAEPNWGALGIYDF